MALQTIKLGLYLPEVIPHDFDTQNILLIDASGEKAAVIVRVPKTGTISKILLKTGPVTNSQTLRISLQTVTNGEPSGTDYGGSALGTQASPATNTTYVVSLGTAATATKGDLVAIVIEFDSTVGDLAIRTVNGLNQNTHGMSFPYGIHFTASWTTNNIMLSAFEYSDGSYESIPGVYPLDLLTNVAYNSGSIPDERALRFDLLFSCRVAGFWFIADIDGNADIVLYEGTTLLQTKSFTPDERRFTTPRTIYNGLFDTPQPIAKDTEYFLSLKPTSGTNIGLNYFTVNTAAVMDAFSGGQQMHLGIRADAGAWAKTTTTRPLMGLIIDQLNDGVGGAPNLFAGLYGKP